MANKFTNNAVGYLSASTPAAPVDGDAHLTIALETGQGAKFPQVNRLDLGGGNLFVLNYFLLTLVGLDSAGRESTWEVVKVTDRVVDVLTVERAQQGTTALSWPSGTKAALRITAGHADNFETAFGWGDHASVGYLNPAVRQTEAVKDASFQAEIGKTYLLNAGVIGSREIALPLNMPNNTTFDGLMFKIRDPFGVLAANPWTVKYKTPNVFQVGKLQGLAQDLILNVNRHQYDFVYDHTASKSWYLI